MGTVATPTVVVMGDAAGGYFEGIFTLLLDTTTAAGIQTVDLTDYFSLVYSCEIGGSLAANYYNIEAQVPGPAVALTSTNLAVGFSEAGADGAVLDLMNATDLSAAITGLTIVVKGKQAV